MQNIIIKKEKIKRTYLDKYEFKRYVLYFLLYFNQFKLHFILFK